MLFDIFLGSHIKNVSNNYTTLGNMVIEIRHTENGESGIFTAWQNDVQVGEMTYKRSGMISSDNNEIKADSVSIKPATEQMVINHTLVYDGYEGHGIARQLVMAAVDFARENNRTILPVCSYAKAVLTRTDEYQDVL